MRFTSLRARLFIVSIGFALVVVGGISLTTYVILSDGMQVVAYRTTERMAGALRSAVTEAVREAEYRAGSAADASATAAADRVLHARLDALLGSARVSEVEFALYDGGGNVVWASQPEAIQPAGRIDREAAFFASQARYSTIDRGKPLDGLLARAKLGRVIAHLPVELPGAAKGILDVTYLPLSEEALIDQVRLPMAILAISATIIVIAVMQTSLAWVLNLVDDLRAAADSIDAGRLEERLPAESKNEIGDLARSINHLIERLSRRAEAQSRFVAEASHEIATPIAGIRGYITILREWGSEDPKVRAEAVDAIDRESQRMARLSNDLSNLLHADQGLRFRSERFDLNKVIRERLAAVASRYLEKDVEFVGPEDESLEMVGDPDRVEDVVSILLDNAGKYTSVSGRVTASSHRKRDSVVVEVSDTGHGIPPEDIERIFDRFFRSDRARAAGETGFGLGLAIAKSIVDNMGGSITVRSIEGQGTTFTVVFPRRRA